MSRTRCHSILGDVGEWSGGLLDAGVVEGEVQATECLGGLPKGGLHITADGDVAREPQGLPTGADDLVGDITAGLG